MKNEMINTLVTAYSRKYSLESVIRLEEVQELHSQNHQYYIEIEVVDRLSSKKGRIAEHVVENSVDGKFCYPADNTWNPDVTVYVIITVKNQGIWLRHFVDNVIDIQEQTNDHNIHPIIVDFCSRDIDTESYLQHTSLKHYTGKVIEKIPWVRFLFRLESREGNGGLCSCYIHSSHYNNLSFLRIVRVLKFTMESLTVTTATRIIQSFPLESSPLVPSANSIVLNQPATKYLRISIP